MKRNRSEMEGKDVKQNRSEMEGKGDETFKNFPWDVFCLASQYNLESEEDFFSTLAVMREIYPLITDADIVKCLKMVLKEMGIAHTEPVTLKKIHDALMKSIWDVDEWLIDAVKRNSQEDVKRALEYGANIHYLSSTEDTPFSVAIMERNIPMASFLIQLGSEVDDMTSAGTTAIQLAISEKDENFLDLLLSADALVDLDEDIEKSYLVDAIKAGELKMAMKLIRAGADVDFMFPLHAATQARSLPLVQMLVQEGADLWATDFSGQTALQLAERGSPIYDYLFLEMNTA